MSLLKRLLVFLCGGILYVLLEIFHHGKSHWSMFLCGGTCIMLGDLLNDLRPKMRIRNQCFLITLIILCAEFITGWVVNIKLKLKVWDYTRFKFHYKGQICLAYGLLWLLLSPGVIWFGESIRHYLLGEKKPMHLIKLYALALKQKC